MDNIINIQVQHLSRSIDQVIIDEICNMKPYSIIKTWRDRRGRKMHRVSVNYQVLDWLATEHNQYGVSNPEWWKFDGKINITDKLYTLLVLRWAA
jgi:hypothetical protein